MCNLDYIKVRLWTLDFKVIGGMSQDFGGCWDEIYFAGEKDMNFGRLGEEWYALHVYVPILYVETLIRKEWY